MAAWRIRHPETALDLGAGDGRFVRYLARRRSDRGVVGVDLCATNLRTAAHKTPGNALLDVAQGLALPEDLSSIATRITITCPWGSVCQGLLNADLGLVSGIHRVSRGHTPLQITLNPGALAKAGWTFDPGSARVEAILRDAGIEVHTVRFFAPADVRAMPTTWAKRLAFVGDPRGMRIEAALPYPTLGGDAKTILGPPVRVAPRSPFHESNC